MSTKEAQSCSVRSLWTGVCVIFLALRQGGCAGDDLMNEIVEQFPATDHLQEWFIKARWGKISYDFCNGGSYKPLVAMSFRWEDIEFSLQEFCQEVEDVERYSTLTLLGGEDGQLARLVQEAQVMACARYGERQVVSFFKMPPA